MSKAQHKAVITDNELEGGVWEIGARYHIRTGSYQYIGTLVGVTGLVFVFVDSATVYETGPYPEFYGSGGKEGTDIQPHSGSPRLIVDRAGTVLHLFPAK